MFLYNLSHKIDHKKIKAQLIMPRLLQTTVSCCYPDAQGNTMKYIRCGSRL